MSDPAPKKRKLFSASIPPADSSSSDEPDEPPFMEPPNTAQSRGGKTTGKPVRKYASACQFCRRRKVGHPFVVAPWGRLVG